MNGYGFRNWRFHFTEFYCVIQDALASPEFTSGVYLKLIVILIPSVPWAWIGGISSTPTLVCGLSGLSSLCLPTIPVDTVHPLSNVHQLTSVGVVSTS